MGTTLTVRLPNWLGDTVMAVPAVRALRRADSARRLAVVGPWATILAGQGLADILVEYPRTWRGRLGQTDAVRRLRPDAALLLPNSLEAALSALYWGARERIGFAVGGRGSLLTRSTPLPAAPGHQIDAYTALAALAGAPLAGDAVPTLEPPPPGTPAWCEARRLLGLERVGTGSRVPRLVGFHIGAAGGPAKLWPEARVREACALVGRAGFEPIVLGAADDAEQVARIVRASGVRAVAGRHPPELLMALVAALDVLVAGDTGVGHLAAAVGTPVLSLFGPTDALRTAPRGRTRALSRNEACAPCFERRCPIEHPCMQDLTAETVARAVEDLAAEAAAP